MNMKTRSDSSGLVPVTRSVAGVADPLEMQDWAEQLVARARSEGIELTGERVVNRDGSLGVADRFECRIGGAFGLSTACG